MLGQFLLGVTTGFDRLRQTDLVILREQWILPDVREVQPYEVFLVALDALLRQRLYPSSDPSGGPCRWSNPCAGPAWGAGSPDLPERHGRSTPVDISLPARQDPTLADHLAGDDNGTVRRTPG